VNHLAHFHLSGACPGRIAGALLADHLRGAIDPALPPAIAAGVRLHRQLDAFIDTHPAVRALRRGFPSPERRFSGIAIDIAFDRILTQHWEGFGSEPLPAFCTRVYAALAEHAGNLCVAARQHAEGMARHSVLARYADEDFARGAFLRVCRPLAGAATAESTWQLTMAAEDALQQAFLGVYPEALALAAAAGAEPFSAGS